MKTYSTRDAAKRMGVGMRTLVRWLELNKIRPSVSMEMGGGQTLWRWTPADIAHGKQVKAAQKPGPRPKAKP
jgi:hypothetical protein